MCTGGGEPDIWLQQISEVISLITAVKRGKHTRAFEDSSERYPQLLGYQLRIQNDNNIHGRGRVSIYLLLDLPKNQ